MLPAFLAETARRISDWSAGLWVDHERNRRDRLVRARLKLSVVLALTASTSAKGTPVSSHNG
jgi:hypothetical protein